MNLLPIIRDKEKNLIDALEKEKEEWEKELVKNQRNCWRRTRLLKLLQ